MLHDDTRDGVEYVFGDRIAELTQDADGVDVAFAGGDRRAGCGRGQGQRARYLGDEQDDEEAEDGGSPATG